MPTLSGAHAVEPIPCWDNLGSETIRAREVGGVQRREGSTLRSRPNPPFGCALGMRTPKPLHAALSSGHPHMVCT